MTINNRPKAFTLIEVLVGGTIMIFIIMITLTLYSRSNRIAVDQNMFAQIQQDVRSAMFLISRDIRMAGVGMPIEFAGYFIMGVDNELQGQGTSAEVRPDRIILIGNMEEPLYLKIKQYQGASVTVSLEDYSFEQWGYPDYYFEDKLILILPNPASGCRAAEFRVITHVTHSQGGKNEKINMSPGLAKGINPPQNLAGTCPSSNDYDGGLVIFCDAQEYWLDVTGNYPGLTPGKDGYIGNGEKNILYLYTYNEKEKKMMHHPIAQNVENLQFEYNGDMNGDGELDGWRPWDIKWGPNEAARIQQVRIFITGCTPRPYL
ncbi:MAG: hypothetical protein N3B16_06655 [Candidatus Aminicenantes bacterium]|nr:hypothetical protein [Candidatus Aminicenantes bacterium]